jgi:glycerol uptake facilitator-like aquaporin
MKHAYLAEFFGTGLLLLVVTGSGVMGESLAAGNAGVALLANSIATGAILFVLISLAGPISGAHFNPIVTAFFWRNGSVTARSATFYMLFQFLGAMAGVLVAHFIFDLPLLQLSSKVRDGLGIFASEVIAVVTLLSVITLGTRYAAQALPMSIALTVTAGYWFTSSTFFANPAVSVARTLTDTFVGISPLDTPIFCLAQIIGLGVFFAVRKWLS